MDTNIYSRNQDFALKIVNEILKPSINDTLTQRICLRSKKAGRQGMQMRDLVNFRRGVCCNYAPLRGKKNPDMLLNTSRLVLLCMQSLSIVCVKCVYSTLDYGYSV